MADQTTPRTLDEIRSAIFNNAKPQSKLVEFFGVQVELRQPTVAHVLEVQNVASDDRSYAAAMMIVNYTFVPGTDQPVFTDADVDMLRKMPFGGDMARMNNAISELSKIDILGEEGNSDETPAS